MTMNDVYTTLNPRPAYTSYPGSWPPLAIKSLPLLVTEASIALRETREAMATGKGLGFFKACYLIGTIISEPQNSGVNSDHVVRAIGLKAPEMQIASSVISGKPIPPRRAAALLLKDILTSGERVLPEQLDVIDGLLKQSGKPLSRTGRHAMAALRKRSRKGLRVRPRKEQAWVRGLGA